MVEVGTETYSVVVREAAGRNESAIWEK